MSAVPDRPPILGPPEPRPRAGVATALAVATAALALFIALGWAARGAGPDRLHSADGRLVAAAGSPGSSAAGSPAAAASPATAGSPTAVAPPGFARLGGGRPGILDRATPIAGRLSARALTVTIVLRRRDQAGFQRALAAVTNPRSPAYRHFIPLAEQTRRYGPAAGTYRALVSYLRGEGLRIVAGSADRLTVTAHGSVAAVERTFAVDIRDYSLGGHVFSANAQAPALPRALAGSVAAIVGLSSLDHPIAPAPQIDAITTPVPPIGEGDLAPTCEIADKLEAATGTFSDALGALGGIEGGAEAFDLANSFYKTGFNYRCAADELNLVAAYAANPSVAAPAIAGASPLVAAARPADTTASPAVVDASTQRIGLLEFANYDPSDVADFVAYDLLDPSETGLLSKQDVGTPAASGGAGEGEALLDIDAALTLAPGARVVVYDTALNGGASFQAMFNAMIGDHDTVISNSWSECEDQVSVADAQSVDSVLATAAAAGISVLNGSGDSGSTCLDGSPNTIGVPADSPHATAVGGSSMAPGPLGTYGAERWWDGSNADPPTGQGGFGTSRLFARPSYQDGDTSSAGRSIPDLVANADPADGYAICEADNGGCPNGLEYGGTSAATPIVAALVADVNTLLGHNLGELNPQIYPLADTSAFHSAARLRSDFAHVGLGSPNFDALYLELAGKTPGPIDTTTSSLIAEPRPSVPADGSTEDTLGAVLLDADDNAVSGQQVTLTASAGSHAVIANPTGVSSTDNGTVIFHVSDSTPESVTFTASVTNGPTLDPVSVTFAPRPAAGGGIEASPSEVTADGQSTAQVQVRLLDALGDAAIGKTVTLVPSAGSHATIAGPMPLQTGANGTVSFTVSDTTAETATFTAVDVTDGNLPVPGSASVTFTNVPQGQAQCAPGLPTTAGGLSVSPFASSFPYGSATVNFVTTGPCAGEFGLAFSPGSQLYASAYVTNPAGGELGGSLYRFGPQGGLADASTELSTSPDPISGIAFGPGGVLYGVQPETSGAAHNSPDYSKGDLVIIDSTTGAITKSIPITQMDCPDWVAVDPLSGDVFVSNGCSGFAHSDSILRIHDPQGTSPTITTYATTGSGGIAFAPDGTLYQGAYLSNSNQTGLLAISGTNTASPGTVTSAGALPSGDVAAAVAVGASASTGHAQSLYAVAQNGTNELLLQNTIGQTAQILATIPNGGGGVDAVVGADGCLYADGIGDVLRVTGTGACAGTPNPSAPQLTVSPAVDSTTQGATETITATLRGVTPVSGVPVNLVVAGQNPHVLLADTNAAGAATFTYQGVSAGTDQVTAAALSGGQRLISNTADITWNAGRRATALDLTSSPQGGPIDSPDQLSAVLDDYTVSPPAPVPDAPVTLTLGSQSCGATTDATGRATCSVSSATSAGIETLAASFAGNSQFAPSQAQSPFALTPLLGSTLAYTGGTTATQGGSLSAAATLTQTNGAGGLAGRAVTFTLGAGAGAPTCTASTDAAGDAACAIGANVAPGAVTLQAEFAGDGSAAAALANATVQVSAAPPTTEQVTVNTQTTVTNTAHVTLTQTLSAPPAQQQPPPNPTPTPTPAPAPATVILACAHAHVTLTDLVVRGSRVLITGAAETSDAGKPVTLRFDGTTKVASGKVQANGLFSLSAPLPPAKLRSSNAARYTATVGGQSSSALKLTRRLVLDPPTSVGGRVQLTGRVIPPLGQPIAPIVVQLQTSCSTARTVTTVKPKADGSYSVSLPDPNGKNAVYRLQTKVRDNTASTRLFATFSLPELVTLP